MTDLSSAPGPLAVGVDIGGTKVAAGAVDQEGQILWRARRDTPDRSRSPRVVEDTIVEVVNDILALAPPDTPVAAIGIGAAGFVAADQATVLFAPHLNWRNEPLRDALASRLALPILIDNDANAAAWAEYRFGAGRGEEQLVMITLGTGIGGGLVINGEVTRGKHGIAGEFGHMQMVPDGHRCPCGNRGCWEQYASGNALVREAAALIQAESPMAASLATLAEQEPGGLSGPLVTAAAQAGDPAAVELLAEVGTWLGVGIAALAAALDPGRFVVGGGVSAAGELLLAPARQAFARTLPGRGFRPQAQILAAQLGNDAGLIGAADLARSAVGPH